MILSLFLNKVISFKLFKFKIMKNIISTILILYILLYIQYISTANYEYTINIESNYIPDEFIYYFNSTTGFNKNKLFSNKIKRGVKHTYFCKNNMCLRIEDYNIKPFIEFPDENGYIHKYILTPYNDSNNETNFVSTECKNNTQCLSNKCLNKTCTYNEKSNIERCDVMYTAVTLFSFSEEYVYCGKMIGESCTKNSECSFKLCDKICRSVFYSTTRRRISI